VLVSIISFAVEKGLILWFFLRKLELSLTVGAFFRLNFFRNLFMWALRIFYILKAQCFGWESLVIFLATWGQRLPGAAGARTLGPSDSQPVAISFNIFTTISSFVDMGETQVYIWPAVNKGLNRIFLDPIQWIFFCPDVIKNFLSYGSVGRQTPKPKIFETGA